jgi:hypothetical protein
MNLPHNEARKKLLEAKAAVLFGNAMDIRAAQAAKEDEKEKRVQEFREINETREVPGMIRWYSKPCHYFIKNRGPEDKKFFKIGLESQIADGTYVWHEDIEFDVTEAPDLMDKICEFNGLPTYSGLLETRRKLDELMHRTVENLKQGDLETGLLIADMMEALGQ